MSDKIGAATAIARILGDHPNRMFGDNHRRVRYSEALIEEIRLRYEEGVKPKVLARDYGIRGDYVRQIVSFRRRPFG